MFKQRRSLSLNVNYAVLTSSHAHGVVQLWTKYMPQNHILVMLYDESV